MSAPLIAVPVYHLASGTVGRWSTGSYGLPESYVEAVRRAGGRALLLTAPDEDEAVEILEPFDGLLLIGGGDVEPRRYGGSDHDTIYGIDPDRDRLEIGLLLAADRMGVPALAICRGAQVVDVAFGGTLHQHLPAMDGLLEHGLQIDGTVTSHDVTLANGSRVEQACRADVVSCSSHHHQGIDRLGDGLVATGWSSDGLVEALEREDGWLVAVQWHPEDTAASDPAQQRLFDVFVAQAAVSGRT